MYFPFFSIIMVLLRSELGEQLEVQKCSCYSNNEQLTNGIYEVCYFKNVVSNMYLDFYAKY